MQLSFPDFYYGLGDGIYKYKLLVEKRMYFAQIQHMFNYARQLYVEWCKVYYFIMYEYHMSMFYKTVKMLNPNTSVR
jgi:hypothetical protein